MSQAALWTIGNMMLLGSAAVQRFFTESNSITQTYGQFTSDVELDGDFKIEIIHSTTDSSSIVLVGNSANSDSFIWTDQNQLRIRINAGGFLSFGTAALGITLSDGKLHTTEIERVAGNITATTDGHPYATTLSDSGTFTINSVAQRGNGLYWDGYLANLKITKAGTLVVDSPMDDAPDATEFRNIADPSNPIQKFNYVEADTLEYVFDDRVSPNTWTDVDTGLIVIEVAGT